ncbi:MAG: hypothetical protein OK439_04495 [Thaumarchaeota archaeon]|nr:hypothetical protein [Nitrososphaerota archaeon]
MVSARPLVATNELRRLLSLIVLSTLLLSFVTVPYPIVNAASSGVFEIPQSVFAKLQRAVDITWNGESFIGSDRANLSSAKLVSIGTNGSVTPFAPSFTTNNGTMEDYAALSQGKAGFPLGYYFVLSFDSIYKIDLSGNNVQLFSTPVKNQQLSFIAFDSVGTWGYNLLALYSNGMIWSISSNGSSSEVADVGTNQNPECVTVAPPSFGSYGGYLIVSEEIGNHSIVAISQTNKSLVFLARFPAEAPERVFPIVPSMDLYVGKYAQGVIEKYPASDFSNFSSSSMLVITEGENGQNGSIDILTAKGGNVTSVPILLENGTHFEGATYAPANLNFSATSSISASSSNSTSESTTQSSTSTTTLVIAAVIVIALIAGITFVVRRRR